MSNQPLQHWSMMVLPTSSHPTTPRTLILHYINCSFSEFNPQIGEQCMVKNLKAQLSLRFLSHEAKFTSDTLNPTHPTPAFINLTRHLACTFDPQNFHSCTNIQCLSKPLPNMMIFPISTTYPLVATITFLITTAVNQ